MPDRGGWAASRKKAIRAPAGAAPEAKTIAAPAAITIPRSPRTWRKTLLAPHLAATLRRHMKEARFESGALHIRGTGFEPATFRPPAERQRALMRVSPVPIKSATV